MKKCLNSLPRLGMEPKPPESKPDTLPHRHKSRLVQQGHTSVDKLSSTTYSPSILDLSSNLSLSFNDGCAPSHRTGYLDGAPNVTGEKMLITFAMAWYPAWAMGSEIRHSTTSP